MSQPDITLVLDMDAVIREVTVSNTVAGEFVKTWLGQPWIDTVTDGGAENVQLSLNDARADGISAYRQIIQRFPSGLELPIEYTTVRLGAADGLLAIGRNLQASSELQSRLIAAQQAMERDYWKLRDVETRYRLLFDASNEAVLVISADDFRVVEANPAAIRALGLTRGWAFLSELAARERDIFRAMLARVNENGRAPGGVFHIGAEQAPWILRASLMSDEESSVYMIQLVPVGGSARTVVAPAERPSLAGIIEGMPDGFALLDVNGVVQRANKAFLDLVQVGSENGVIGRRIDHWLRRPGADMKALVAELRKQGEVRLFATTIQGDLGQRVEIEASAGVDTEGDIRFIGVVLRDVGTRIAAPANGAAPPTLPALDNSPGKAPLKVLVRAAVAVVERHYVESALDLTEGNRTAAAELLGLSRQSLYSKLNRYGFDSGT